MLTTLIAKSRKFAYMTRTIETIGERIRRARADLKLTQMQIAEAAGVSAAAVAQWETGDTKTLKAENLFRVARRLGKSAEWLATGEGPEQPKGELYDAIANLPDNGGQQVLDFIEYRIDKAEGIIASDQLASYSRMIEHIREDMKRRKK